MSEEMHRYCAYRTGYAQEIEAFVHTLNGTKGEAGMNHPLIKDKDYSVWLKEQKDKVRLVMAEFPDMNGFSYVQKTILNNWSRSVLTHHIESNLFKREGKAITNFKATLPKPQSDLARETLKDVHKPIGVSEYIITKNLPDEFKFSLPSIEEIEVELSGGEES